MEDRHDAFGHALRDFLEGRPGCAVVERDDGYVDASEAVEVYFDPRRRWPRHVKAVLRYALGRVLDAGCGAGRHALDLEERGFDVVGIDSSPLAVRVCRARGLGVARVIPVTRIPPSLGPFDTILLLGNNFGLLGGLRRGRWLLRRFDRLTGPRGRILAETIDPHLSELPVHREYRERNRARGRLPGQLRLRIRYQAWTTPWMDYLLASPEEMRSIVAGTGWRVGRVFAGEGARYAAVIEKE